MPFPVPYVVVLFSSTFGDVIIIKVYYRNVICYIQRYMLRKECDCLGFISRLVACLPWPSRSRVQHKGPVETGMAATEDSTHK